MWELIEEHLQNYPQRLRVARILVENGLSIRNQKIYVNEIEVPPVRVARVAGVDRRTVGEAINAIMADGELRSIFGAIRSAGHSLREIARQLDLGVVEITPINARTPGILANSAMIIARSGLSIRQAIVDDPELSPEPKLTLIVEKRIPGELISEFLRIPGVAKVSIY